jgi:dTDP-4-dehydrorhamnose reductase
MSKVLLLGSTGMLGHSVKAVLGANTSIDLISTSRIVSDSGIFFDAEAMSVEKLIEEVQPDFIVNSIGIIKPHIDEKSVNSIQRALDINSSLPNKIAKFVLNSNIKVIQIATDCVFSGNDGLYSEDSSHDALDVYGKTKSLGETVSSNFMHLRVSIVGPEVGRSTSLLEWFKGQEANAKINGFKDHLWNGITTHHFGLICEGIITKGRFTPGVHHIIPSDTVSKDVLLGIFGEAFNRKDIEINPIDSQKRIDRTLKTLRPDFNLQIWKDAGYANPPTIKQMVFEQAKAL